MVRVSRSARSGSARPSGSLKLHFVKSYALSFGLDFSRFLRVYLRLIPLLAGFLVAMFKFKLRLFSYRLFLNFRINKGRAFSWRKYARFVRRKVREIEPRSVRLLIHKAFAHKRVKTIFWTNLAIVLIATSFLPTHGFAQVEAEEPVITEAAAVLKTEKAMQYPVGDIRITQGFRFYHPGVDLDGLTGDPIYPIKKGRVKEVSYSRFSYGNAVVIEHEGEVTSLYAHLSKIEVEPDQEVTTETVIGEMGATGRSFGDHLHLEIRDHGRAVNPTSVLPR